MGRTHHLKQTLLRNIHDNETAGVDVEFVVLNYSSRDGMHDWVMTDPALRPYLDNGTLVYAHYEGASHFRHSHAKNMAHRIASGGVLCNLDADNFTGPDFAGFLVRAFSRKRDVIVHPSYLNAGLVPPEKRGFFGRIAVTRENFAKLGGYDESYKGWGGEDTDFMLRAQHMKLWPVMIHDRKYLSVINHGNTERLSNVSAPDRKHALENLRLNHDLPRFLADQLKQAITYYKKPHNLAANNGVEYGAGKVSLIPKI